MQIDSGDPKQVDLAEKRKKIKLCAARRWIERSRLRGISLQDNDAWKLRSVK